MTRTTRVRHGWTIVDGLRLHHLEFGNGGHPVVCLHGVTGNAWAWHDVGRGLAGKRVLAFDFRGHGDSQWSASGAYTSEDHRGDLEARLDALGEQRVDLVGSSWGALVAIAFAARAPDRVRRLAIVDIEASFDQGETDLLPRPHGYADQGEAVAFERRNNPHGPEELVDLVAAGATRPGPEGGLLPKHDPYFFERWPFRSDDVWDRLGAISCPTLLVHAEASFVRCEVMERMAAAIAGSRLVHLPDTTHVVPEDNPSGLLDHLVPFLTKE